MKSANEQCEKMDQAMAHLVGGYSDSNQWLVLPLVPILAVGEDGVVTTAYEQCDPAKTPW
jgi:hypothetical protein